MPLAPNSLLVAASVVLLARGWAAAPGDFARAVQLFFEKHCLDCHDSSEQKGGLNLETLQPSFATPEECATWTTIFDRLERGEMPPPKKERPPAAAQKAAMQWIGLNVFDAETKRHASEGRAAWRRLNRNEYQNTIRDLLLVEVDVKSMLPEDGLFAGFDNVDAALDVSSIHLEKYLEAAEAALDAALVKVPKPNTQKTRYSFLEDKREIGRSLGKQILVLPDAAVFVNELYPPKRMDGFRAPFPGKYRFRFSAYAWRTNQPLPALIYAGSQNPQRGKTELTQVFDVPPGQPVVREWVEQLERGDTVRIVTKGPNKGFQESLEAYHGSGLAVQWIEAEGPIDNEWPAASNKRLIGFLDLRNGTQADAEKVLRGFAPRAFRRNVTDTELVPYFALVQEKLDLGGTFEEALRVALKAMLVSPDFLFFQAAPGKLDDDALASRLSYFLWSSMPDDALLDLAAKKQLSTPANLRAQVERMLADPKAKAFTNHFTGLWLKLRDIKATMPDQRLYPEFDELLEWSMLSETHEFFDEVLRRDLSLLNFVQSDFAMLNSRLAEHYGIPGVEGLDLKKVALKPEWNRGGVLTQAAVLKVTANGTNTSPVVRGAFFLDRILGRPSPPPPQNVAAVEPDTRGTTTIRAQLEKHRDVELCATCHSRIDPPGAALESYDVIGGYREKYRALTEWRHRAKDADGRTMQYGYMLPCETDATLTDGRKFTNLAEFKKLLLEDGPTRDQIARNLTQKLLTYATGHTLDFADRAVVTDILHRLKTRNYGLRTLVHERRPKPHLSEQMNRRNFLRAAGVTLALPVLEHFLPRGYAVGAQKIRRMVCMNTSLGIYPGHFFPTKEGRDFDSTPYLDLVKDHREQMTVFSGVSHPGVDGGHSTEASYLTGAPHPGASSFRNTISLDQWVAEKLGATTRVGSLVLTSTDGSQSLSFNRSGVMLPADWKPSVVFKRLFIEGTANEVEQQVARLRDGQSIMDLVLDQTKRLQKQVGAQDRARLDQYFTSVREVEERLKKSEEWSRQPKPKVDAPPPQDVANRLDVIARTRLLYDLVHLALQTDSTRLATVSLVGFNAVPMIDGVAQDWHNLSHHGKDPAKIAELRIIEAAQFTALNEFLGKLKATADQGGTLLDHTMVLYGANLGNAASHDNKNMPMALFGGGFKHAGHLAFDRQNNTAIGQIFVSMLQRMGFEVDQFSSGKGPITGLELA